MRVEKKDHLSMTGRQDRKEEKRERMSSRTRREKRGGRLHRTCEEGGKTLVCGACLGKTNAEEREGLQKEERRVGESGRIYARLVQCEEKRDFCRHASVGKRGILPCKKKCETNKKKKKASRLISRRGKEKNHKA